MNKNEKKKIAAIAGAGPAGLTAAYEFLDKTDIQPIVFEQSNMIGGISQTVCYGIKSCLYKVLHPKMTNSLAKKKISL